MLPRILPWLWRLADEGQGHVEVAPQQQQQLLTALAAAAGSAQDPQVGVTLYVCDKNQCASEPAKALVPR